MQILKLLKLDKDSLLNKQAERLSKALAREQEDLINKLSSEVDGIEEQVEKHEELNLEIDPAKWVETYQDYQVKLELVKKKLEIAKRTKTQYFTEEETK